MGSNTNKLIRLFAAALLLAAVSSCFEREGTARDLAGTTWLVEDIGGRSVIDFAQTTIEFPEAGRISGNTGCNQYSAQIWFNGERYGIKGIAVTERACTAAVMDQEKRFLGALEHGQRMVVAGSFLRFYDADENSILRLTEKQ